MSSKLEALKAQFHNPSVAPVQYPLFGTDQMVSYDDISVFDIAVNTLLTVEAEFYEIYANSYNTLTTREWRILNGFVTELERFESDTYPTSEVKAKQGNNFKKYEEEYWKFYDLCKNFYSWARDIQAKRSREETAANAASHFISLLREE